MNHGLQLGTALLMAVFVIACTGSAPPTAAVIPTTEPTAAPTDSIAPTLAPTNAPAPPSATMAPPTSVPATVPPTSAPTAAPVVATEPPPTSAAPTVEGGKSTSGKFGQAELDQIFPPGRGQDLVFRACNNCHNWVPIAISQPTIEQWGNIFRDHRPKVGGLTDEEFAFLEKYLVENFGPHRPPPENIPEDLLLQWTSY